MFVGCFCLRSFVEKNSFIQRKNSLCTVYTALNLRGVATGEYCSLEVADDIHGLRAGWVQQDNSFFRDISLISLLSLVPTEWHFIFHHVFASPIHTTWLAVLPCNLFDHSNFFWQPSFWFLIYQIQYNSSLLLSPCISPLGFTHDCYCSHPLETLSLLQMWRIEEYVAVLYIKHTVLMLCQVTNKCQFSRQ